MGRSRGTTLNRLCLFLTVGLVIASTGTVDAAVVRDDGGADPSNSGILPEVTATPWTLDGGDCSGWYATTTTDVILDETWEVYWVGVRHRQHTKTIATVDFSFSCDVTWATTVTGSGGVYRRIGILHFEERQTSTDAGVIATTRTYEDSRSCAYDLPDGTSCTYRKAAFDVIGERGNDEGSLPAKVTICQKDVDQQQTPEGMVAYNRANHPLGGIVDLVYEATYNIPTADDGGSCISDLSIRWERIKDDTSEPGHAFDRPGLLDPPETEKSPHLE